LLHRCLVESRRLYNEMLEASCSEYTMTGKFLFKHQLRQLFRGRGGDHVPATTVQALAARLDKTLRRYLCRNELGQRVGFPRFKGSNRWHSIQLRQYGKGRDAFLDIESKRLRVPGKLGKAIKVKQHRPLEGVPKTAHLVLRADGKWYVIIACDLGKEPPKRDGLAVGLDVGLTFFLTDSNGDTVENPRPYRKSQKRLRRKQRRMCRRKRGSKRHRKAARAVAKTHLKIARQRNDFLHKVTRRYVDQYANIVVENLHVAGLVRNHHLAKSINDAGWFKFVQILESKAESAGCRVVKVPAPFTTQICSLCGKRVPKSLSVRTHVCVSCGHVEDRDVNAAKNVLRLGRSLQERTWPVAACVS
jgi:putative transposase